MQTPPIGSVVFVVDLTNFMNRWHLHHVASAFYPKADLAAIVAFGASIEPGPAAVDIFNEELSKISPDLFEMADLYELSELLKDLHDSIEVSLMPGRQMIGAGSPVLFYKWVGPTTISLMGRRDKLHHESVRRASRQAAHDHLYQATIAAECSNGPFYRP